MTKMFFFLFMSLLMPPLLAQNPPEFSALDDCIATIEKVEQGHIRHVPALVLKFDKTLYSLSHTVEMLRKNRLELEQNWKEKKTALSLMVVGNALVSCENRAAEYQKRASSFISFLIAILVTLGFSFAIALYEGFLRAKPVLPQDRS